MIKVEGGVEVRSTEVELTVKFEDLTQEGQQRVFLENMEKFIKEALNSKYPYIRRLLWEVDVKERCSSEVLNAAIQECIYQNISEKKIFALLNVSGFQVNEKVRELLATSTNPQYRLWLAKNGNIVAE